MDNQNNLNRLKNTKDKLGNEFREKTTTYVLTAFGLVAGLAWNDAIKSLIEYWFPTNQNSVLAKLIYAAVLTIIVVIVSIIISRLFAKKENDKNE